MLDVVPTNVHIGAIGAAIEQLAAEGQHRLTESAKPDPLALSSPAGDEAAPQDSPGGGPTGSTP